MLKWLIKINKRVTELWAWAKRIVAVAEKVTPDVVEGVPEVADRVKTWWSKLPESLRTWVSKVWEWLRPPDTSVTSTA